MFNRIFLHFTPGFSINSCPALIVFAPKIKGTNLVINRPIICMRAKWHSVIPTAKVIPAAKVIPTAKAIRRGFHAFPPINLNLSCMLRFYGRTPAEPDSYAPLPPRLKARELIGKSCSRLLAVSSLRHRISRIRLVNPFI